MHRSITWENARELNNTFKSQWMLQSLSYKSILSRFGVARDYTGCPRRNVPYFGRVFLMLKYTDITQNIYVQSWTVTEIMTREKCGLLSVTRTIPISWEPNLVALTAESDIAYLMSSSHPLYTHVSYLSVSPIVLGIQRTAMTWFASFFVVRFNGVTSLTS
jgi:hypothetical protein